MIRARVGTGEKVVGMIWSPGFRGKNLAFTSYLEEGIFLLSVHALPSPFPKLKAERKDRSSLKPKDREV